MADRVKGLLPLALPDAARGQVITIEDVNEITVIAPAKK